MNPFRTELVVPPASISINYHSPVLAIGSCFVSHIGSRLLNLKFPITINPFGIVFNPASVVSSLERLSAGTPFSADELFQHHQLWHSPAHHGQFSHPDPNTSLFRINQALTQGHQALQQSTRLIITLGTAQVFIRRDTGQIVANCHKLPGHLFERRRLSVQDIVEHLSRVFIQLKNQQPELQIILTVSPVRYLREGFTENQRSKASLLLATEALSENFSFVHYFPAYELFMDDLRDYRFCEPDMIHPNATAIEYIWQAFISAFIDDNSRVIMQRITKINSSLNHKALHPESDAHRQFVRQWLHQVAVLETDFPFLDFSIEKEKMTAQNP
jgi:hypothetical protein